MWETTFYGPTIRQQYKMAAIQGLSTHYGFGNWKDIAYEAEVIADAAVAGDKERNND